MNTQLISEHLSLLNGLSRREVLDMLFNIGHTNKAFSMLLGLTHLNRGRRQFIKAKEENRATLGSASSSFIERAIAIFNGGKAVFNSYEYHIMYTLVENNSITSGIRESLKEVLNYSVPNYKPTADIGSCSICSYPTQNELCLSCRAKVSGYLRYRRETFSIPINYLNFNIRKEINEEAEFNLAWYDWRIHKSGREVTCTLVPELAEGYEPIEYELPFVDYQKVIS